MTWAVGDKAASVESDPNCECAGHAETDAPDLGSIDTVTRVDPPWWEGDTSGLAFEDTDPGKFLCSCGFRKIVSDQHEDCEPEFVTLLKRINHPSKEGVGV